MTQTPARPSSLRATAFRDGLGERRRMADASGVDKLEILCLHRDLASAGGFEQALRERAARLADFRHDAFARVRTVERLSDPAQTLVVASEPTLGVRLAELLQTADRRGLALDGSAEWSLIRQISAALCSLHQYGPVAHGALAAERIVITPEAKAVIVEYVLGGAIERLQLSAERLWKTFRIACPPLSGPAALNQRADITQLGVVSLSIILGRPLGDEEYPARLKDLMESAWAMSAVTDHAPVPDSLRSWLARALQLDPRSSFESAVEAHAELEKALRESEYSLSPKDLEAFLTLCQESAEIATPNVPHPAVAAASPVVPVAAAPAPPPPQLVTPVVARAPEPPVARRPEPAPQPFAPIEPQVEEPTTAPAPSFLSGTVSTGPTRDWKRLAIAAGLLVAVVGAGWAATNRFSEVSAERASAIPAPAAPVVNATPPAPEEPAAESTPIAPLPAPTGQIDVRSTPPGAAVTIAGSRRGVTPLIVSDLAPGRHTIQIADGQGGSVSRSVTVEAGITASVSVQLETAPPAPTTGAVAITAPAPVDIFENGRLLGSSQGGRLTLPVGAHQLEIVNQALGYRITRTVQVAAGTNVPIALEFPKGTLALNAIPWAEVFVDGERVGDTPIGNLPVSLGTHEVVFRNPDLGEQRMTATVTLTAPTRLSVDLRKR